MYSNPGRVAIGEFLDRHHIPLGALVTYAKTVGLHLARRLGPPLAFSALLRPCAENLSSAATSRSQLRAGQWGRSRESP